MTISEWFWTLNAVWHENFDRTLSVDPFKDQNQALLEKINSLNEENKQIQSAQDAQYAVLFEKINQLSKDNHQDWV